MKPASDYKPLGKAILVGGAPKAGKTTLATMFPNAAIVDWDHNLGGAIAFNKWNKLWFDYPDTAADGTPLSLEQQWKRAVEITTEFILHPEVQTIIWDSLTPAAAALMAYVMSESNAMERELKVGGIQVPTKSHYQPFAMHLQRFLTKVRQSTKLFILTAHLDLDTDELTLTKQHMIMLVGKMKSSIPAYFSDYWHCKVTTETDNNGLTKPVYYIEVQPTNNATLANTFGLPSPFRFTPAAFKPYWDKAMGTAAAAKAAAPAAAAPAAPKEIKP